MSNYENVNRLGNGAGQVNNGGNAQASTKKKQRIEVEEHETFDSTIKTKITTTLELTKKINSLFRLAGMTDFYGSTLKPNPQTGALELALYFKPENGDVDGIQCVERVADQRQSRGGSGFNRIVGINSRNMGRTFQLTESAKEMLEEFLNMNGKQRQNGFDWNRFSTEVSEQVQYGGYYNVYVKVFNINLSRVLSKIWGYKDEEGGYMEYNIMINKVIPGSDNMVITIQQLHNKDLEELAAKIGIVSGSGSFNIIR